jgi:hypothetical protein
MRWLRCTPLSEDAVMTLHYLHHGGAGTRNADQALYPAATPAPIERLHPAAHKEPIAFGITRLLDFSQKDGRRQAGLQQYLERAAAGGHPLQANDLVTLSALPAQALLLGVAWGVEEPEAGVTFDLKLLTGGQTLVSNVNAATVNSDAKMLTPLWFKVSDFLVAEFTSFPANGASALRFWVSPMVLVPQLGN